MANPQIEDGRTEIANETMDIFCRFRIPGEVRQIIDTVIRKTYGWHKIWDKISNSQFMEMTKLSKGNVSRSLLKAITHKFVIKNDNNQYCFNKHYDQWIDFKSAGGLVKVIKNDNTGKVIKFDTKVIKNDNKKLSNLRDTKAYKSIITKAIIPTVLEASPPDKRNLELQELLDFSDSLNFVLQGTQQMNRFNAYNLWKKFGLEKSKVIVRAAVECRGKLYAPRISDFIQLYRKVGDLNGYYQEQKGQQNEFRNFDN